MRLVIQNPEEHIASLVRKIGYRPLGTTPEGEWNCVRPLGGDYPRFHMYIKQEGRAFICNLHLDQKRPSYAGSAAHSGEYEGETVQREAHRIEAILSRFGREQ